MRFHDGSSKSGTLNGTPFVSPIFVGFRWSPQSGRLPSVFGVFRGQMSADRLSPVVRHASPAG